MLDRREGGLVEVGIQALDLREDRRTVGREQLAGLGRQRFPATGPERNLDQRLTDTLGVGGSQPRVQIVLEPLGLGIQMQETRLEPDDGCSRGRDGAARARTRRRLRSCAR